MTMEEIGRISAQTQENHGFGRSEDVARVCALFHSEVSELLEAFRAKDMPESKKIPGFTEAEEEVADLIIRVLGSAYFWGMRVEEAVRAKMAYNSSRPYKHGKRF